MVIARVALKDALAKMSSPGIGARTSWSVAPQRWCQRRHSGAVTNSGEATTTFRRLRPILRGSIGGSIKPPIR
jgi:hypothetical protein